MGLSGDKIGQTITSKGEHDVFGNNIRAWLNRAQDKEAGLGRLICVGSSKSHK